MSEKLDLWNVDSTLELNDDLLRVDAEALAMPADEVGRISCISSQLADYVSRILARTVEDFEVQETLWLHLLLEYFNWILPFALLIGTSLIFVQHIGCLLSNFS